MITLRNNPVYVNRVRESWQQGGGVSSSSAGNDPFATLGSTLDLVFAGVPNNLGENGPSIDLYLYPQQYQIAVQYAVWGSYSINYSLLPNALLTAAAGVQPEAGLFRDTLIGGRALGDINNSGTVTSADSLAYDRFTLAPWLNASTSNDYIRDVLNPYMINNPGAYAAYLTPGAGLVEKTFSDLITFTRASTGTYFNSAGTLTSAAIDQPRFDYNPSTLAAQGLLIEESRTNSIRNNTMQGAVAGTPGTLPTNWSVPTTAGLTTNVIGTGTSNGITYIDLQITGTTTGTGYTLVPEIATQIAALNGQSWTFSAWWSVVAGNLTNVTAAFFDIRELDSGGVQLTSGGISVASPTSTFTRITASRTNTNASTAFVQPRFRFTVTNSAAVNFTLRIGLPQLELGAFATSVILTDNTLPLGKIREKDVASVNTLSPWYNASAGTTYFEGVTFDTLTSAFPRAYQFNDGTNNNVIQITRNNSAGNARMSVVSGGVAQAAADATTWTLSATTKAVLAYATNDFAIVANGGAATTDSSGTVPTVSNLLLGSQVGGASFLNGYLRRITYYPRRLANADLQAITA